MNGPKPQSPAGIGRTPRPGHRRFAARWVHSPLPWGEYLFSMVELVALRRVAPRPAAQRLPTNRVVGASRSAAARGGVVAARQPLPLDTYWGEAEPFSTVRTIQTGRFTATRCALFPCREPEFEVRTFLSHPVRRERGERGYPKRDSSSPQPSPPSCVGKRVRNGRTSRGPSDWPAREMCNRQNHYQRP